MKNSRTELRRVCIRFLRIGWISCWWCIPLKNSDEYRIHIIHANYHPQYVTGLHSAGKPTQKQRKEKKAAQAGHQGGSQHLFMHSASACTCKMQEEGLVYSRRHKGTLLHYWELIKCTASNKLPVLGKQQQQQTTANGEQRGRSINQLRRPGFRNAKTRGAYS